MKHKSRKINTGFVLLEMLFYITLVAVLSFAVINSLITMTKSFKETSIQADFVQSGNIMERMSREIKQAHSIYSISTSDLKLNTEDELGNDKTIRFYLSGSNLQLFENDVLTGNLNSSTIQVTALSFTQITTTVGKAIKVTMSVRSTKDITARIENFYSTVVLRGDYGN